jgi:TctA family transporter
MLVFGFFAYILRKFEYPLAPFLIALILGPKIEKSFRQSMTISQGNPAISFNVPFCYYPYSLPLGGGVGSLQGYPKMV